MDGDAHIVREDRAVQDAVHAARKAGWKVLAYDADAERFVEITGFETDEAGRRLLVCTDTQGG